MLGSVRTNTLIYGTATDEAITTATEATIATIGTTATTAMTATRAIGRTLTIAPAEGTVGTAPLSTEARP